MPGGTRILAAHGQPDAQAVIRDAAGQVAFRLSQLDGPDYFAVPVPPGQDGRFWTFHYVPGPFLLLTVPPYSARSPEELLLPERVQ